MDGYGGLLLNKNLIVLEDDECIGRRFFDIPNNGKLFNKHFTKDEFLDNIERVRIRMDNINVLLCNGTSLLNDVALEWLDKTYNIKFE